MKKSSLAKRLSLFVIFAFLISCTGSAQTIPFQNLVSGQYSGLTEKTYQLINSQEELNSVWQEIYSIQIPPPPVPAVNFSKNSILLVALGEQKTSGYSIEIVKIEATSKEARVYLNLIFPSQASILLPALTQPFMLVKTTKINKAVQFVETNK